MYRNFRTIKRTRIKAVPATGGKQTFVYIQVALDYIKEKHIISTLFLRQFLMRWVSSGRGGLYLHAFVFPVSCFFRQWFIETSLKDYPNCEPSRN